jgi:hypothetical protein
MVLFDGMLFDAILREDDIATNRNDESGRYRMLLLNQAEHDDPEQAPTYRGQKLVRYADVWVTPETAKALEAEEA